MTPTHTAAGQPITIGSSTDPFYGAPNTGTGVIDQSLISETTVNPTGPHEFVVYVTLNSHGKEPSWCRHSVIGDNRDSATERALKVCRFARNLQADEQVTVEVFPHTGTRTVYATRLVQTS